MMATLTGVCALLIATQCPATQAARGITFTGLSRQPDAWYVKSDGPVTEASICTDRDKAGRPCGVAYVFPSGVRRVALYFRAQENAPKGRVKATLWHQGAELRFSGFEVPRKKPRMWWVTPRGSKTFLPGLYTFELVFGGELLAALDFAVISAPEVDAAALGPPGYTDAPPPPRAATVSPAARPRGSRRQIAAPVVMNIRDARSPGSAAAATPPAAGGGAQGDQGGSRRHLVDDLIASARQRSTDRPDELRDQRSGGGTGSSLGSLAGGGAVGAAVKVVASLFGGGSGEPSDFTVRTARSSQKLADHVLRAKGIEEALVSCGGRTPVPSAAAGASDTKKLGRGVLLLPLKPLPDDSSLMALLVIDDVSVALNDAPVEAENGFELKFRGDTLYVLPIVADPPTQSVKVLDRVGRALIAGPAQMAVPEAKARNPFASVHQVIPLDDTADRAVAICSLTPALDSPCNQAAVFPLLLSRHRK